MLQQAAHKKTDCTHELKEQENKLMKKKKINTIW